METGGTLRLFFVDGATAEATLLFEDRRDPEAALFQNGMRESRDWQAWLTRPSKLLAVKSTPSASGADCERRVGAEWRSVLSHLRTQ